MTMIQFLIAFYFGGFMSYMLVMLATMKNGGYFKNKKFSGFELLLGLFIFILPRIIIWPYFVVYDLMG